MQSRAFSRFVPVLAVVSASICAAHAQEAVLYSFSDSGFQDPFAPQASLIMDSAGNLYGTTSDGFSGDAVFELSPQSNGTWAEKTLHSFSGNDGAILLGNLIFDKEGNLYGTTKQGGSQGEGTVFELSPESDGTWSEKVLYNFGSDAQDGTWPAAGLIFDGKGNLYGTNSNGVSNHSGAVFELIPKANGSWTENVIWRFSGGPSDGCVPLSRLAIDSQGDLFGTTAACGSSNVGTVFELTPQTAGGWSEKVIHNFCSLANCADGILPYAGVVIDDKGDLFGTASGGGKYGPQGVVYELIPQSDGSWWNGTVIHNFDSAAGDGKTPVDNLLIDIKGNLFGTTQFGGHRGLGIVFELSPGTGAEWPERILHNFNSLPDASDGSEPLAGLIEDKAGNLYGTTSEGGIAQQGTIGDGTVFEIFNPDRTGLPAFSVPAGTYTSTQTIKLSDYSAGATIYYTTNGAVPTTSSEKYTTEIKVEHTETIKALAVAPNLTESEIATAKYTIELPTATPVISPKGGTYTTIQHVTIACATSGAEIFYTTNGAMPTATSKRYVGPIKVAASEVIKAIAIAKGFTPSGVASVSYTIHLPPTATPVFSPAGGTYPKTQSVTITDATSGAEIYFTTNGDTPTASSSRYYGTPISVGKTKTLKAIAFDAGHTESKVASATYTIQ